MRAFRYNTKISKTGVLEIPINPSLFDQEVEITIISKSTKNTPNSSASNFIKKWAGFLKNDDSDHSKLEYLSEKYK